MIGALGVFGPFVHQRPLILGAAVLLFLTAVLSGHESVLRQAIDHQSADIFVVIIARTIGTIWWLVAAWLVTSLLEVALRRIVFPSAGQPRARKLFSDLFSALIYLLALFCIATFVFDQPLTGLIATSGVLAIVLGLALQSTLSDVFSGLALNIELPFRAGDWITVAGEPEGRVIEINWRATRIQCRSGDIMIIPNSVITKACVTNHYPPSRGHISKIRLELDDKINPKTVIQTLEAAAIASVRNSADTPPKAVVRRYGDDGIIYELYFTIEDFALAQLVESDVLQSVWLFLDRAGIHGPAPRHEITLLTPLPNEAALTVGAPPSC
jgi:small-conductance mechanosensitive channel